MRKQICHAVAFITCALGSTLYVAWAQDLPKVGKVYKEVKFDLNQDGKAERIGLVAYNQKEADFYWGQLTVWDSSGKQLWQAPKGERNADSAFAFGSLPWDTWTIDWVGDLDGDKQVDLISAMPPSDMRPTPFNRYKWDGKQFQSLGAMMLIESPAGSQNFLWTKATEARANEWRGVKPLTWVTSISGSPSDATARITAFRGAGKYSSGQASLSGDAKGVTVKKWLKRLTPNQ